MQTLLFLFMLSSLIAIPVTMDAFAEKTYDINIPTGAASPDAPYFWQSEKDGSTTGDITIIIGDTINWKNADTAAHTVTSGTIEEGPDDIFDSSLFGPGKTFTYQFNELGDYPYFCIVHPWMKGTVFVTSGYSIIPNVGKQVGDGKTTFDVEYGFNRLLSTATVDESQKSITFTIIGDAKSDNNDLEILLPTALISGPFVIWADNNKVSNFEVVNDGDVNIVMIPLTKDTKSLTITGTSVVPEFGAMAMVILGVSVVSMIVLTQKARLRI